MKTILLNEKIISRFWPKVDKLDKTSCWIYKGSKVNGYGCLSIGHKGYLAHRISYLIHYGKLETNENVCHHCDNPPCVNPHHLFKGTMKDNCKDRDQKNRGVLPKNRASGESNGRCKLTTQSVKEIKEKYETGNWTHRSLGKEYGVSHTQVRYIINNISRVRG